MSKLSSCRMPRSVLAMCASHFLSTWGDRMWSYAVAIFLVEIGCGLLLLPAIFGLVVAAVNFLGSTLVGKWVDSAERLTVIKVSLFVQNLLVTLCAGFLILLLLHESASFSALDSVYYASLTMVIVLGAAANLIGQATTIAVERDWVVVIANGDSEVLAGINAIMRRIDLINKIVSPLPVSFLMSKSVTGLTNGAIFIAAWNIVSGVVEYFLLLYVYKCVPALARKATARHSDENSDHADASAEQLERLTLDENDGIEQGSENSTLVADSARSPAAADDDTELHSKSGSDDVTASNTGHAGYTCGSRLRRFILLLVLPYTTAVWGWKVYRRQTVLRAGLSLSLLYMTVLGFNGITNGFLYSQGLEVWQVSVCQAAGALFGVLGTFIYHPIRRRVGVRAAGLVAIWGEALCLVLCAASVFLSGNPATVSVQTGVCDLTNTTTTTTTAANMSTSQTTQSVLGEARQWTTQSVLGEARQRSASIPTSSYGGVLLEPVSSANYSIYDATLTPSSVPGTDDSSRVLSTSLVFFLIGIVTARIGLWMFDLAITQLYQIEVAEEYRGTVGGVQSALNSNMDLLHFVLVISFPHPQQFGGLVMASCAAVLLAAVLYSTFVRQQSQAPLCTVYAQSGMQGFCCWRGRSWSHITMTTAAAHGGRDGNTLGDNDVTADDDDDSNDVITNNAEL